ncbi:MAG: 50S ribosomal protein L29 [Pelotomaculum sp. PtaU1.Bin035]|nr:MAG: 50S ribosomal protein L29 [Pelotomaculum sp. PtaU1.Bin035]
MRSLKVKDIRELTDAELNKKLDDTKDELFKLRFQMATGQLDNPMKLQEVRRRIARVKTIIRERELGIQRA